jgi:hypothetical protein
VTVEELIGLAQKLPRAAFERRLPGLYLVIAAEAGASPVAFRTIVVSPGEKRPAQSRVDEIDEVLPIAKAPENPYPERISVGRARNCDVVLRDGSVSKLHAHFYVEGDALDLVDLESQNGTRVNGRTLAPHERERVLLGDELEFGTVRATIADAGALFDLFSDA